MKRGFYKYFPCRALLSALLIMMAACEPLFDGETGCEPSYYIEFVYEMNMDRADAFAKKVSSVSLYAFDSATGVLARIFTDSGEALSREGYRMRLDLVPGNYDFVAWCGLEGNGGDFTVSSAVTGLADTGCSLSRARDAGGRAFVDRDLHALFHGKISANLPYDNDEHVYTMPLVKNTNNINLSIQDISGKAIDPDRFDIRLTAGNGEMAFDNTLLEDEEIDFFPYVKRSGTATVYGSKADDAVLHNDLIVTEMSTARLIADKDVHIDIFDNEAGSAVYSIPLVKWALMLKSQQYSRMGDQEYLDREDEFNIILYVKGEHEIIPDIPEYYLAVSVLINSWRIVLNDGTELGH